MEISRKLTSWEEEFLGVCTYRLARAGGVIVFPYPGVGHLSSRLHLAHLGMDHLMLVITVKVSAHSTGLALVVGRSNNLETNIIQHFSSNIVILIDFENEYLQRRGFRLC